MTPRIGLILLTALLMQCGNPVETPLPGAETIPARLQETTHFNGGNAMFHAARMTEMGDRGSGTPGYRQQLDYLKKELAKHGWTCQEQSFEQETSKGPIQFVNLRARFGKAPDFQAPVRGLLTCHIDTKQGIAGFTGANDGASGAAAILDDHVPFMDLGMDTLNIIDDFQDGNWWHTSKDNIGILGEKSFKQTGEMTLHILRQLLPDPPST